MASRKRDPNQRQPGEGRTGRKCNLSVKSGAVDGPIAVDSVAARKLLNPEGLLRIDGVLNLVPVARSTWWLWVRQGIAPQPIRLGQRCTAWKAADVLAFVDRQAVGSNN